MFIEMTEIRSNHSLQRGSSNASALAVAVAALLLAGSMGSAFAQTAETSLVQAPHEQTAQKRSWLRRFFCKPTWEQAVSECATPRDVCRMVERHVSYKAEAVDQWATARETWKRGAGDCKHFAVCVQTLCKELGFEGSIKLYYSASSVAAGHAIAIGTWNGQLWLSSNGSYEEIASEKDAAERVSRVLWCKPDKMWTITLADSDVDRMTRGESVLQDGSRPAAVSAAE